MGLSLFRQNEKKCLEKGRPFDVYGFGQGGEIEARSRYLGSPLKIQIYKRSFIKMKDLACIKIIYVCLMFLACFAMALGMMGMTVKIFRTFPW